MEVPLLEEAAERELALGRRPAWQFALARMRLELSLLRSQLKLFVAAVVGLLYGAMMAFRNLAFWQYARSGAAAGLEARLQDAGFAALPDLEDAQWNWVGDLPIYIVNSLLLAMGVWSLRSPPGGNVLHKPFMVNILLRYVSVLTLGHTVRFVTYISTVYPGSSEACLDPEVTQGAPTSLVEALFKRFALRPGQNCGDLLFSGHLLQMIVPVLLFSRYGQALFLCSKRKVKVVVLLLWISVAFLAVSIIARRHHYTQDVVLGAAFTPLFWHYYSTVLHPRDAVPPRSAVIGL